MKQARPLLAGVALRLAVLPSSVQASAKYSPQFPVRIRAIIEKFDKSMLTVKTEKGGELALEVTTKTNISSVDMRQLTDIKPNDFVGVTAVKGTDGKLHATEVHIFPEGMRGFGVGRRGDPERSVTNATARVVCGAQNGREPHPHRGLLLVTRTAGSQHGFTCLSVNRSAPTSLPCGRVFPADLMELSIRSPAVTAKHRHRYDAGSDAEDETGRQNHSASPIDGAEASSALISFANSIRTCSITVGQSPIVACRNTFALGYHGLSSRPCNQRQSWGRAHKTQTGTPTVPAA